MPNQGGRQVGPK